MDHRYQDAVIDNSVTSPSPKHFLAVPKKFEYTKTGIRMDADYSGL